MKETLRLIDSHVGLGGLHIFAYLFAWYSNWLHIIGFSIDWRWFVKRVFIILSFGIDYHPRPKYGRANYYPPLTFRLKVLNVTLFDTGAEAARKLNEWAREYTASFRAEEEAKQRLLQECLEGEANATL